MTGGRDFAFGRWVPRGRLDPADLASLMTDARARSGAFAALPVTRLCELIGRLREHWARGGRHRQAFLRTAPERSIGWSRPMIEHALDAFAAKLDADVAHARIRSQLGDGACLDGFVTRAGGSLHAAPLGVVLHVVSGNVFFGPAESLLTGLLSKNVNIVKQPSGATEFLPLFVQSVADAAPELTSAIALLAWPGGRGDVEACLAREVDGIVVAAGPEVIAAYRHSAAASTALIEFGPRASIAVVSAAGSRALDPDALARDVALWEQFACTNAQCVYVEGRTAAQRLAAALAAALERFGGQVAEGDATLDERIEVARLRDLTEFAEALGGGRLHAAGAGLATVVFEDAPSFEPSPLRRCVRVKSFGALDDLAPALAPVRGVLQTVGLAVDPPERAAYERCAVACGARRVCDVGRMNAPAADGLHDGTMELHRLVRWVQAEPRP